MTGRNGSERNIDAHSPPTSRRPIIPHVRSHVNFQISLCRERPGADCALKRLLSRMCSHMNLHSTCRAKVFVAYLTLAIAGCRFVSVTIITVATGRTSLDVFRRMPGRRAVGRSRRDQAHRLRRMRRRRGRRHSGERDGSQGRWHGRRRKLRSSSSSSSERRRRR